MKPYKTLLRRSDEEYIIQKSRFIGQAAPVATQEEAIAFVAQVRQEHRNASHHCFAYIIGQNAGIMRYSDDGEPSGTAGLPIMEVLKARGVVDCVVVVTRYFGGILLGAGGLVRAYSHSCALALTAAVICEMLPTQHWLFEVGYPVWDRVQHALKTMPVKVHQIDYGVLVSFTLQCRSADSDQVHAELQRVTDGRLESLLEAEDYQPWDEAPTLEV